jgi:hypothetical protein
MSAERAYVEEDFEYLLTFLPPGWKDKAKELGALKRCRKVPDAEALLRMLLIHLAEGYSLRETAVQARRGHVVDVSDVTVMDRLKQSGAWFQWMNEQLMNQWVSLHPRTVFGANRSVRVVDATRIKEPGPTGSSWCLHYSIQLPSLACDQLLVCDPHGSGETFKRFDVQQGDLFVGDRVYGVVPGIAHVVNGGGDVLVRFAMDNLPLYSETGRKLHLLPRLRKLRGTKLGDWPVTIRCEGEEIHARVCAIKKSRQATERARKQVRRRAQKDGTKTRARTLELAGYLCILTTLAAQELRPSHALEMYRGRWQIELVFKRLKSILALGHLRKTDPDAAIAWLHGKLLVAFLVEALIRYADSFSPWGYPLCESAPPEPLHLA